MFVGAFLLWDFSGRFLIELQDEMLFMGVMGDTGFLKWVSETFKFFLSESVTRGGIGGLIVFMYFVFTYIWEICIDVVPGSLPALAMFEVVSDHVVEE